MLKTRYGPGVLAVTAVFLWIATPVHAQGETKSDPGVAAYVGGKPITIAELDAKALKTNMKLAQSIYDARRAALDEIILERALSGEAAKQQMTVDQLIAKRVAEKTTPVTDADVAAFFNSNRARMGGRTLEQVGPQIKSYLEGQNTANARTEVLAEVKKTADVKVALEAPRAEVIVAANDPVQGPADAKVTITLYSDFQ